MNRFELRNEGALSYGELAVKRQSAEFNGMPWPRPSATERILGPSGLCLEMGCECWPEDHPTVDRDMRCGHRYSDLCRCPL